MMVMMVGDRVMMMVMMMMHHMHVIGLGGQRSGGNASDDGQSEQNLLDH